MNRIARWVPIVGVPAVVIAGGVALPAVANADQNLPPKSAQQVLSLISHAKDAAYSGTVQQTSNLGLPQLPSSAAAPGSSSAESSASNVLDLLGGTHRIRVYVDGATKQRVQVLDQLAERDVVRNGSTVWTWDSKGQKATKMTLPSRSDAAKSDSSTTPEALAKRLIDRVDPTTTFSVSRTGSVAGRNVYRLTMAPKAGDTLVKDVVLSVDATTGLPLKVEVDAVGQKDAAVTVGYTAIDYGAPDAKLFDFTAPKGAKVSTKDLSQAKRPGSHAPAAPDADATRPTTVGTGWSRIAILPAGSARGKLGSGDAQKLFGELTQATTGGRALQTSLVSVLFADDGRVLVGAVPLSALQAAAG